MADMTKDARDAFSNTLKDLGFNQNQIDRLLVKIVDWQAIYTESDILENMLPTTDVYAERFSGNANRIKNGLKPLNPNEYLAAETSYRAVLKDALLPEGFYDNADDFAGFIGQNTSPAEMKTRVDTAYQALNNSDPAYKKALQDMYGIDEGMLAAHMLDADRASDLIMKQAKAVEYGVAAAKQGLTASRLGEQFASKGPSTGYGAEQGYAAIASMLPATERLGQVYGQDYNQATAEQEVFNGLASAKRKRQKLGEMETATFSGQSGLSAGSLKKNASGSF